MPTQRTASVRRLKIELCLINSNWKAVRRVCRVSLEGTVGLPIPMHQANDSVKQVRQHSDMEWSASVSERQSCLST